MTRSDPTTFGIPFLARLSDLHCGFDLHKHYMRLLNPFSISIAHVSNDFVDNANEDGEIDDTTSHTNWSGWPESDSESGGDEDLDIDFRFYFQGELVDKLIEMNEPVLIPRFSEMLKVCVLWSDKMMKKYNISQLSSLPMVFKTQSFFWSPQDSVSLYKCLEVYLKEEPLGLEDMWLVCNSVLSFPSTRIMNFIYAHCVIFLSYLAPCFHTCGRGIISRLLSCSA